MAKRTKLQNSIIHAQRTASGISEENYRALVFNLTNGRTESSKDMTQAEADELIKGLGGTPPPRGKGASRRTQQRKNKAAGVTQIITQAQIALLLTLAEKRWGKEASGEALRNFCLSPKVINKPRPTTSKEANRVIETLKSMARRDALKATEEAA